MSGTPFAQLDTLCDDVWRLVYIQPTFVGEAWKRGAADLLYSVDKCDGECTLDQLKAQLFRGDYALFAIAQGPCLEGWLTTRPLQYQNKRILCVTHISASGACNNTIFEQLAVYARTQGCSQLQGFCQESVARLWQQKFGFYEAYRVVRCEV